jgi:hypothetical protein
VFLALLWRLLDRYHARAFLTGVVFAMGLVMVLLGQMTTPLGLGALTAFSRWFERYRGRALGIVSLGYAFGELTSLWGGGLLEQAGCDLSGPVCIKTGRA